MENLISDIAHLKIACNCIKKAIKNLNDVENTDDEYEALHSIYEYLNGLKISNEVELENMIEKEAEL